MPQLALQVASVKVFVVNLPAAAHARGQGPDPRPDAFLRAARLDHAVAGDQDKPPREGVEAAPRLVLDLLLSRAKLCHE